MTATVDFVELRVVRVPLRQPFANAVHVTTDKVAVLVTVGHEGIEGYGEGVMEPLPWFREETVDGALTVLGEALVPDLLRHGCADPAALADRWTFVRGNPMAKAALEMAVWDLRARQQGVPLWQALGGDGQPVPVGAAPSGVVSTVGSSPPQCTAKGAAQTRRKSAYFRIVSECLTWRRASKGTPSAVAFLLGVVLRTSMEGRGILARCERPEMARGAHPRGERLGRHGFKSEKFVLENLALDADGERRTKNTRGSFPSRHRVSAFVSSERSNPKHPSQSRPQKIRESASHYSRDEWLPRRR